MKDASLETIESGRPESAALVTVNFCLRRLVADRTKRIADEVVSGLTFEELLGALLQARDLAEDART